jgi:hypothetical protein
VKVPRHAPLARRRALAAQWRDLAAEGRTPATRLASDRERTRVDLEVTVEILDPEVAQALVVNYERDMQHVEPYDATSWANLPWWKKALAWISYRCRRVL